METSSYLFRAGGKRLRPAFALLAARFHDYKLEKVLPVALSLELAHMATLVHDDVVDGAGLRRGKPSVKALWGNRISTHTGDYLLAQAMLILLSNYQNPIFVQVLAHTCEKMCEGELIQFDSTNRPDLRDYLRRIRCKTALLIQASCQLGAVSTGAPPAAYQTLGRFGYCLGMAFQITDDVLDMVADPEQLGKPVGGDLRQGIITLPVIFALAQSREKERLSALVAKEHKTEDDVREAIRLTKECGGIDMALQVAGKYLDRAQACLGTLPDIPARRSLSALAEFIRGREY
jgi:heptaprenyl diphosphate synthase